MGEEGPGYVGVSVALGFQQMSEYQFICPLVDVPGVWGRGMLGYLRADRAPTGMHSKCE